MLAFCWKLLLVASIKEYLELLKLVDFCKNLTESQRIPNECTQDSPTKAVSLTTQKKMLHSNFKYVNKAFDRPPSLHINTGEPSATFLWKASPI